jgi:hypothetical protein
MNADLEQRAAMATHAMPWTIRGGIEEKLLEESSSRGWRRTSLVRLPPGGELVSSGAGSLDVLVLDGTVTVERARLTAGMFLHGPAGKPLTTADGCTIFVKQRPATWNTRRTIDTAGVVFEAGMSPGLSRAPLHSDLDGDVVLLRFDPGTIVEHHHHDRGEEFFVLAGGVQDEHGSYGLHDWVRQPPDSAHTVASPHGCLFFTVAHHL